MSIKSGQKHANVAKLKVITIVYNFAHPWYQHMVPNTIAWDNLRTIPPLRSPHGRIGTPSNLLTTRTMKMGKLIVALVGRSVSPPTNYYIRVLLSALVYPADMSLQWCAHLWGCLWGIGAYYPSRTPSLVLGLGWWLGALIPYLKRCWIPLPRRPAGRVPLGGILNPIFVYPLLLFMCVKNQSARHSATSRVS